MLRANQPTNQAAAAAAAAAEPRTESRSNNNNKQQQESKRVNERTNELRRTNWDKRGHLLLRYWPAAALRCAVVAVVVLLHTHPPTNHTTTAAATTGPPPTGLCPSPMIQHMRQPPTRPTANMLAAGGRTAQSRNAHTHWSHTVLLCGGARVSYPPTTTTTTQ